MHEYISFYAIHEYTYTCKYMYMYMYLLALDKGVGTLRAKIGPISEMKQTLKNENTRFTECKSV